jgi:hypothetical protein
LDEENSIPVVLIHKFQVKETKAVKLISIKKPRIAEETYDLELPLRQIIESIESIDTSGNPLNKKVANSSANPILSCPIFKSDPIRQT